MKVLITSLWLFAGIASGLGHVSPAYASSTSPLPAADCIQTDRINDWRIVSARTAIVRTGPKNYLVTLSNDCPQLSHPPGLIFSSGRGIQQGRICGSVAETVHSLDQPPCAIKSVQLIDQKRYEQLAAEATRYRKSGAEPDK